MAENKKAIAASNALNALSALNPLNDPRWMVIRASKMGIALTLAAGLIAAIIIVTLPLTWWVMAAMMFALIALLALEISRLTLRHPDSVIAFYLVMLDPDHRHDAVQNNNLGIRLRHRNGRDSEGRVRDGAFVMPWFMNIAYDDEKRASRYRRLWPRVLPLWRDALSPDDARRARVTLRWQ